MLETTRAPRLDRRGFLRAVGAAGAFAAAGTAVGCGTPASGGNVIRIGYVSPETGSLALFAAADQFVIDAIGEFFAQNPIRVGGRSYAVEIIKRDSQSNTSRASDVAADLILNHGIHMMLVSSAAETVNPVSDQCESYGMPCVSTVTPWEPWFFGRGGQEGTRFTWTYNFYWGRADVEAVFADMWDQVATNRTAGAIWPTDAEGLDWGDPTRGFAPAQVQRGYQVFDSGNYAVGTLDFTPQIAALLDRKAEILVGLPNPPDFAQFWRQATDQGFQPKIATIAKALLFPGALETLGEIGVNLASAVAWSPSHPYTSSLTGQSAADLAGAYTQVTGDQWTQPIGFVHALFEVAVAAFGAVDSIEDRRGIADAVGQLKIDTVVGPLDWTTGPLPNVARTPVVGGQWRAGTDNAFELVIVDNTRAPNIPTGGRVEPLVRVP